MQPRNLPTQVSNDTRRALDLHAKEIRRPRAQVILLIIEAAIAQANENWPSIPTVEEKCEFAVACRALDADHKRINSLARTRGWSKAKWLRYSILEIVRSGQLASIR